MRVIRDDVCVMWDERQGFLQPHRLIRMQLLKEAFRDVVRTSTGLLVLEHASKRVVLRAGVEDKRNDKTVKTQHFGENENEDHADEETRLLGGTTHTGVTDNADGETSGETGETDRETGTELDETGVERHGRLDVTRDEHTDYETVNGNDTGHNDGNDTLDQEIGSEDTHGRDTDTRLGGTVRGAEAGEDDGSSASLLFRSVRESWCK